MVDQPAYAADEVAAERVRWRRMKFSTQHRVRALARQGLPHPDPGVARTAQVWAWSMRNPPKTRTMWLARQSAPVRVVAIVFWLAVWIGIGLITDDGSDSEPWQGLTAGLVLGAGILFWDQRVRRLARLIGRIEEPVS